MISAGEVGAVFKIDDLASPVLKRIIEELNATAVAVDRAKLALAELKVPPGLVRSLNNMTKALNGIDGAAGKASSAMVDGFTRADGSVDRTIGRVGTLRRELQMAGREASDIRLASGGGGGGGGRSGAMHRGSGGGEGHHSSGLGHIKSSVHIPGGAHLLTDNAGVIGAVAAAEAVKESFVKGSDLQNAENQLRGNKSNTEAMIRQARAQALELGGKYGFSAGDLLRTDAELTNPLGSLTRAMEHLPTVVQGMVALRAFDSKKGGDSHVADDAYDLVKSTEFQNAVTPEKFDDAFGKMIRATVATGGKMTPKAWLQFSQYSRGALSGLNEKFLYDMVPELVQEYGGSGAGTSLASLYQQVVSGQQRTTGMNLLDQLGYIDGSKVRRDHNGRIVSLMPGANVKAGEFANDPAMFAAGLVDALAKKGFKTEGEQRQWEAQIFGNRNAAQMMQVLAYQTARLNKGAGIVENTMMPGEVGGLIAGDSGSFALERLKANFDNFFGIGGEKAMPLYSSMLNAVADWFGRDAKALNSDHPLWPTAWGPMPGQLQAGYVAPNAMPYSLDYYQRREKEIAADPEAHRAAIMGSKSFAAAQQQQPQVTVNVSAPKVDANVTVTLDGAAIAAAVSKRVNVTAARVTNDSNGFDGRQHETYPDSGMH